MKLLGLTLCLLVGFASFAKAGIFVEPYAGYGLGSYDDGAGEKGKVSAVSLGARIGGEMNMLFIGADVSKQMSGKIKADNAGGTDEKFTGTQLYGVVGANLPILRLWAGYGLLNEIKMDSVLGDVTVDGGSHIKLGVGFKIIPMVSLNVEYLIEKYKKIEVAGISQDTDFKSNTLLLSASVPLSF